MITDVRLTVSLILSLGTAVGCGDSTPKAVGLPPIPEVTGPLRLDVVYPNEGEVLTARDSNLIFGDVGNGRASLIINGQPVSVEPNGAFLAWLPVTAGASDTVASYKVVAMLRADTLRLTRTVRLPATPASLPISQTNHVRIAPDGQTDVLVALEEVPSASDSARHSAVSVEGVWLDPKPDLLQVLVSLSALVPYRVRVDERRVTLMLYGAHPDSGRVHYDEKDDFLRTAEWELITPDRYALHLEFDRRPWGYRVFTGPAALVLEVRKPPPVDSKRPLAGRKVVVDPGHPPAGAEGPTRLYEGDVNLAVALRVQSLLKDEGAEVILTRSDRSPVLLDDRLSRAQLQTAEVLVSIHNNALADGMNPFRPLGTTVHYFQPFSVDLAQALLTGLVEGLGLPDHGVTRADFRITRSTWLPSALTEGAFIMIPAHEAALRDPDFLDAYAHGIAEGLKQFFRGRAE